VRSLANQQLSPGREHAHCLLAIHAPKLLCDEHIDQIVGVREAPTVEMRYGHAAVDSPLLQVFACFANAFWIGIQTLDQVTICTLQSRRHAPVTATQMNDKSALGPGRLRKTLR
jgi:hypothetical protein